ncbi:hypothetical protein CC80DRAFT_110114 [Byssothecium circinans]|uniref:Uncharacterized protein n=1 Tax=Byssothecium circinans TaxID=147558 RepID=A0A6A5TQM0_9PLEO|nr:hypothetical protein CC80DRAFT_110114 [Byssothecium circinans]
MMGSPRYARLSPILQSHFSRFRHIELQSPVNYKTADGHVCGWRKYRPTIQLFIHVYTFSRPASVVLLHFVQNSYHWRCVRRSRSSGSGEARQMLGAVGDICSWLDHDHKKCQPQHHKRTRLRAKYLTQVRFTPMFCPTIVRFLKENPIQS